MKGLDMEVKLFPPRNDKNWNIQLIGAPTDQFARRKLIAELMRISVSCDTSPFLQGNYGDWIMIEFWTYSESNILDAAEKICELLKKELIIT
jgi:hypothetical protein